MASRRAKQVLVCGWAVLAAAGAGATLVLNGSTDDAPGRYGWYEHTPRGESSATPAPVEDDRCATPGPDQWWDPSPPEAPRVCYHAVLRSAEPAPGPLREPLEGAVPQPYGDYLRDTGATPVPAG
ncbi:hypothetical protein ACG5V6_10850 [Streptomyces chitinivorans]|uniref:Uncharacterized protein n=1 Tax=Streptomyces chitinivorans TaxID=1257027 RepID=A0ABW7HTG4_9ACTN|nr:hypothetical protein [Streptomyces chitinivorans]MDH2411646.1 hypothetical protein [Streptomyces chitinivorans]